MKWNLIFGQGKKAEPQQPSPAPTLELSAPETASAVSDSAPVLDERAEVKKLVERFFGPRQISQGRFEIAPTPMVPRETIAAIARTAPTPIATTDEIKRLRDLDRQYAEAWALANSLSPHSARQAFLAQQNQIGDRARTGTAHETSDAWSLTDYLEDHKTRVRAAREGAKRAAQEAEPIIREIAARFRRFAASAVEEELIAEYRRFRRYGVRYVPGALAEILHASVEALTKFLPREDGSKTVRPRDAAAVFGIEL
jgi:hypothetical protein